MLPSLFSLFSLSAQVQIASDASPASLSFHDDAHNEGDTAYDRFNTGCNGMPSTGSSYSWMMYSNGGSPQQGAAMGGFMTMQSWANHGSGIRLAYSGVWSPTGIQCNGAGAFELVIALGNAYPNGASEPNYVSVAATNGCPSGNIGGGTYVAGQSGVQPYVQHCPVVTSGTPFYVQAGCGACRIYIAYVICRPLSPPSSPPPGLCTNTCEYASDGMCQDGSTGSVSVACALGTDCEDCGNRLP